MRQCARVLLSAASSAGRPARQPRLAGRGPGIGGGRHLVAGRRGARVRLRDRRPRRRTAGAGHAGHADHGGRSAQRCTGGQPATAHRAAGRAPGAGAYRPRRRRRRYRGQAQGAGRRGAAGAAGELVHGAAQFRRRDSARRRQLRRARNPTRRRAVDADRTAPLPWTPPTTGCRRCGASWTPRCSPRRWAPRTPR